MATREKIKETWQGDGVFRPIAGALNRLAKWCNCLDAAEPITIEAQSWGIVLKWAPWESPFLHPWRVTKEDADGLLTVLGGVVCDGTSSNTVSAVTGETATDGWKCYLEVKHYYATGTASTYTLKTTTGAWPAQGHTSVVQTTNIRVGEIVGTTLYQYLYSDQFVPRILPPVDPSGHHYLRVNFGTIEWVEADTCP